MEIFQEYGIEFFTRYAHIISGITWIGLLYYFNFVQTPALASFEAGPRVELQRKLLGRAMWWFRWGAVFTVLSGISLLIFQEQYKGEYMKTPGGISITTGILFGLIMLTNVWAVIWRNQKIAIASAQGVLEGKPADPAAADAARKGLLASRTNVVLSIPLLWFMGFTAHLSYKYNPAPEGADRGLWWAVVIVLALLLELNALGVIGGFGQGPTKKYLETHKNAIITGFVITAALYLLFEVAFSY